MSDYSDYEYERPIFDFEPFEVYYELEDKNNNVMMTYQALSKLAEMTAKLLVAWEKRAAADLLERHDKERLCHLIRRTVKMDKDSPVPYSLNIYQLEVEERSDLRSYSVWKLKMLLGGAEEVMKLRQLIDNISNFVKRIIFASVGNSLPYPMPYPVIDTILSYLLSVKGAVNIGPITTDDSKVGEIKDMEMLYIAMANVFDQVKVIMFYIGNGAYHTLVTELEPSITKRKEMLEEKFEVLVATVKSTQLQVSFEGLDIKDIGGVEDKVAN